MTATLSSSFPEALLDAVFASDNRTPGRPELLPGTRAEATRWLRRALVDFDALSRHLERLQVLHGQTFRYSRPTPDFLSELEAGPFDVSERYRHRDPLSEAQAAAIADGGPEALASNDLAKLLLNPVALLDLFTIIDELTPSAWIDAYLDADDGDFAGTAMATPIAPLVMTPARDDAGPKPRRTNISQPGRWVERLYSTRQLAVTVAASLLIGAAATFGLSTWLKNPRVLNGPSGDSNVPKGLIEFHADHPERPADWETIWNETYSKRVTSETNVDRLYRASGPEIKKFIDDLRKRDLEDFEILTALKQAYGSPEK